MNLNEEVEIERAKLKIYILEKENKIMQDNIGLLKRDNDNLFNENNALKGSRIYKLSTKIKNIKEKMKKKK